MKIYLNWDYGEVCAGSETIHRVQVDGMGRPFIEAGEKERKALDEAGLLEGSNAVEEIDENPLVADDAAALALQKGMQAAAADPAPDQPPASYVCKTHKREHKAGSSAYVACWDANFSGKK